MRITAVALVVLVAATTAFADLAADKRDLANRKLGSEKRLAACERILAVAELSPKERAWALHQRGGIHESAEAYEKAIEDYDKALELDPGHPAVHRDRGIAYFNSKRYDAAEADWTKALEIDSRHAWTYWARARARVKLKQYDGAGDDYGKALAENPRYLYAYSGRARVHLHRDDYKAAIDDCEGVLALDQFHADGYAQRGAAYEGLGDVARALRDSRLALSLNPNLEGLERRIERLQAKVEPSGAAADAVPFAPPEAARRFAYFHSVRPTAPPKSEMEESIGALAGWFTKERRPVPVNKVFLRRTIAAQDGGITTVTPSIRLQEGTEKPFPEVGFYRAMWPLTMMLGRGDRAALEYETDPIDALWPLKPGNTGEGKAVIQFLCPDGPHPLGAALGCEPGKRVPVGSLAWKAMVKDGERVVVPAGVFHAHPVRFEVKQTLEILGQKNVQTWTTTWWYAPSVRWWVKRAKLYGGPDALRLLTDELEAVD